MSTDDERFQHYQQDDEVEKRFGQPDHAMWRRVKLVPFSVVIPDDEQDKALQAKLKKERSGILNWLIEGCLDWQRNGLKDPKAVRIATADYRAEQDLVAAFVDDRCTIGPNAKALTADTSTTLTPVGARTATKRLSVSAPSGSAWATRGSRRGRDRVEDGGGSASACKHSK